MTLIEIGNALQSLRPRAAWALRGNTLDGLEWLDTIQTRPTDAEILATITAMGYVTLREKAYPPIGDQLDALWKGGAAADEMKAKIVAVKAKFPKGE